MSGNIKVAFTEQQAQALLELIDRAVKAGGLAAAENALVVAKIVIDAASAARASKSNGVAPDLAVMPPS